MDQLEFQKILTRYREGLASDEEKIMIDGWYEKIGKGESIEVPKDSQWRKEYWNNVQAHIHSPSVKSKGKVFMMSWNVAKIAASIVFFLGVGYFYYQRGAVEDTYFSEMNGSLKTVSNEGVDVKTVNLPDGTSIQLDPGASVAFDGLFDKETREVYLRGEAFFSVNRDEQRPFMVYANEVVTKVLGTSFRIKAADGDKNITVSVSTGRVCVYTRESKGAEQNQLIVTPNQQVVFDPAQKQLKKELVAEPAPIVALAAAAVRTKFENASVLEIFKALEEMYGIEIQVDEERMYPCTLTTTFAEGDMFKRLGIICKAIGATYRINETTIIIEGSGCK